MTAIAQDGTRSLSLGKPEAGTIEEPRTGFRSKFLSVRGRCGVRSYHARIAVLLAAMVPAVLPLVAAAALVEGQGATGPLFVIGATLFALATIAVVASSVCIAVQRLHDLGRSGWFLLLSFLPVANVLLALYYCFVPGKPEPNAFGPAHEPSKGSRVLGAIMLGLTALAFAGGAAAMLFGPSRL